MSKVGILGGTFDPIHFGHLINAQFVLENRDLDKIIFIPNYISPHKLHYDYSSPEHRFKMLELAIAPHPHFDISDYEINKSDISYTVDTVFELSKKYDEIDLIIGFDNLITFNTWERPDEILKFANLVVMKRTYDKHIKSPNKYFGEAIFVDTPTIEISSTDIRNRVAKNLPIDFLVPHTVKNYILENKLYKKSYNKK